jgi:hypothetical protein
VKPRPHTDAVHSQREHAEYLLGREADHIPRRAPQLKALRP